jgi:dTMP kinase
MKKARYICFEGTDGAGKTTQIDKLVEHLRSKGLKVLQTSEPGTPLSPLTMTLRGIMLDKQYDAEMTSQARELVSQAIRSISYQKVVAPALQEYDYIIQSRGNLSALAYGKACGHADQDILYLGQYATNHNPLEMYDCIIYLRGDVSKGLQRASSAKQEYKAGDAMEAKGVSFLEPARENMDEMSSWFPTATIFVDGKGIEEVFQEILKTLEIEN